MSCELINGIVGVCEYSASGVQKLWVANKGQVEAIVYAVDGSVTGLTLTSGSTFYEIVPALDSCTFNDDLVVNGSRRNFLQTVNFAVGSISKAILTTLETIGLSNMVAILLTSEGDYRAFGLKGTGLKTTVLTEASGTSTGNDGAIGVTISGNNKGKASFVAESVITTLGI